MPAAVAIDNKYTALAEVSGFRRRGPGSSVRTAPARLPCQAHQRNFSGDVRAGAVVRPGCHPLAEPSSRRARHGTHIPGRKPVSQVVGAGKRHFGYHRQACVEIGDVAAAVVLSRYRRPSTRAVAARLICRPQEHRGALPFAREQRQLEIVLGLASDPEILLLDELAAGLLARDSSESERRYQIVSQNSPLVAAALASWASSSADRGRALSRGDSPRNATLRKTHCAAAADGRALRRGKIDIARIESAERAALPPNTTIGEHATTADCLWRPPRLDQRARRRRRAACGRRRGRLESRAWYCRSFGAGAGHRSSALVQEHSRL